MNESDEELKRWDGTYSLPCDLIAEKLGIEFFWKPRDNMKITSFKATPDVCYDDLISEAIMIMKEMDFTAIRLITIYKIPSTDHARAHLHIVISGVF